MRNCNPLNDYLFKYVFGREERKHITIAFLNAVLDLDSDKEITDIEFVDRELDANSVLDKSSRLDILAKTDKGEYVNIEVQVANLGDMKKRSLYYWASVYSGQLKRGESYSELRKTIAINVVDFVLFKQHADFQSTYEIWDKEHQLSLDALEIRFLEIPKFKSKSVKEMRRLERWMAYFRNELNSKETAVLAEDSDIKAAIEAESVFMQTDEERAEYDAREKQIRDQISSNQNSYNKGKLENQINMIRNAIESKLDIDLIAKLASLSKEEVLTIIKEYNIK